MCRNFQMQKRKRHTRQKFVMVIDLARCKNLRKCQSACNHMHQVHSGQNWIKVLSMQDGEHTAPYWQPTTCMHCDEPPCVKVCPVDATFKRQDGLVLIDGDRCIGCRFVWLHVLIQQEYLIGRPWCYSRCCRLALFIRNKYAAEKRNRWQM